MVEPQAKKSTLRRVVRLSVIVVIISMIAVPLALSISKWQDSQYRQASVRMSEEMVRHALGPDNPPSPESFYPIEVVSRPPLVNDFSILSVAEAVETIDDDELVIGVTINGKSRAYPINVLTGPTREVFNDELGGRSIAATW